MRRFAPIIIVLLLIVAIAAGFFANLRASAPSPADEQVRVEQIDAARYPQLDLYVSVRDEAGNLRGDLGSADFTVYEDGVPVDLVDFVGGGGAAPLYAALVIDRSGSMEDDDKIDGARAAAAAFVDQLRPADQAAIIGFNDAVDLRADFSSDQAQLNNAIDRLRPDGGTALYDAVIAGVDLLRTQPGRRVLLVLADGQDCRTPFDGCPDESGSENSLDDAIAYARSLGQPVYVVGLGDGDDIDEDALRTIADDSGGRYFAAPDAADLAALYADVAGAVQQEYRLSYLSPRPFYDGTRRDIAVSVAGATAGAAYTERHLINVTSSLPVGLVLLVPLIGLLLLPDYLRRRRARQVPVPQASPGALSETPATVVAPLQSPAALPARCANCSTPLRPQARFCPRCGAATH